MLFLIPLVNADTATDTLLLGESVQILDRNITLVSIGDDRALFCVNNVRKIVDDQRVINEVEIDIKELKGESAKFDLQYTCTGDCICDDDCKNDRCIFQDQSSLNDSLEEQEEKINLGCVNDVECSDGNVCTTNSCISGTCQYASIPNCGVQEIESKFPILPIVAGSLFGLLFLLVIIYLIKR